MKPSNLLIICSLVSLVLFSSCKKTSETSAATEEMETTYQLSADQGTADNFAEDDNDILTEASDEKDLGHFAPAPLESNNILACATITVTPQTGFPKTITIDFGPTNCQNPRTLVWHRGKVIVVISDTLRRPGATAVMTFDNYYVNNYKREGTHTWTNTSTPGVKSWQRKVENGKITAPDGRFWLHNSIKDVVQTTGVATPRDLFDDTFVITGHGSVTNSANVNRTWNILQELRKRYICENIDRGTIRFEGPNHYAVLDFGNGDCDRLATISINGNPPRQIILH